MSGMNRAGLTTSQRMAALAGFAFVSAACGAEPATDATSSAARSPDAPAASSGPGSAPGVVGAVQPLPLDLTGGPDWLAADDRYLYVRLDRGAVVRIDPDSDQLAGSVDVGGELCQGLGVGYGAVWTCRGDDVVRLDFETGQVTTVEGIVAAENQANMPAGFDRIWVLTGVDGSRLVGIDPATNQADPPIELGILGSDIAVTDTAVWVSSRLDDAVVKIDPATRTVTARLNDIDQPESIAVGDDLWAGGRTTSTGIDPDAAAVVDTVDVGTGPAGAVAADGSILWVRDEENLLRRVDPATGSVDRIDAGAGSGGDVLVAFGSVWTTANDEEVLYRLPAG